MVSYGARRVPGLRREELAQLAGVSMTYYTRLEQGHSQQASDEILLAIARALRLDADETAHLRNLARPANHPRPKVQEPEPAREGTRQLVSAMSGVAALAMDRRSDVLAWNSTAHRLLAGHYDEHSPCSVETRPNLTRMLFLDPHTRELYADWELEAERSVASLRLVAGRHPDDRYLAELIGELSMKSPEFAQLWSGHSVLNCSFGTKLFQHPEVGRLELGFEVVQFPDGSAHRLLMYTAPAGTPSAAAFALLERSTTPKPS
jgi:transcriptional regulator with XRE-family HTH domain